MRRDILGTVVRGHRLGSGLAEDSPFGAGTIALQTPLFKAQGLDLASYFSGTLNISIAPLRRHMHFTTGPRAHVYHFRNIKWHPGYPPEDFFFCPCHLVFAGETYDGWIYYPDPATKIGHFQNESLFEIIAPPISKISYGDQILLAVDSDDVEIID